MGGLLTGCTCNQTDLNKRCTLLLSDGGAVSLGYVCASSGVGKDFITLGTPECDEKFCVRDSHFGQKDQPCDGDLNGPAYGYCSQHCQVGGACPSYDSSLDNGPDRLSCDALLLDTETLFRLQLQGITDSYFCARGADGG